MTSSNFVSCDIVTLMKFCELFTSEYDKNLKRQSETSMVTQRVTNARTKHVHRVVVLLILYYNQLWEPVPMAE